MKFLCDDMLGTLSRWLRILGHDADFGDARGDDALLERARAEGRVLLTRDRQLAARAQGLGLYIPGHDLEAQLEQVVAAFHLTLDEVLSRCSLCNTPLEQATLEEARASLPGGITGRHDLFWRCPSCLRLYWAGSHYKRIVERIEKLRRAAPTAEGRGS
jgi:hypothetical protein